METTSARLARLTPVTRDRYVDFLRAASIVVVVVGHWLLAIVAFGNDGFSGENALGHITAAHWLTWVLQVMPLFFFAGGFSNLRSWRRAPSAGAFIRTRYERLLTPMALLVGAWLILAGIARVTGAGAAFSDAMHVALLPLWFLGVYLILVAAVPATVALHDRFGARVPIAFLGGALAIDIAARGLGLPVGAANFALVWLLPHQLGFLYADGVFDGLARRTFALAGLLSLAVLGTVVAADLYPASMVGVPGGADSNNSPPTFALAIHSIWMVAAAMFLRAPLTRWLAGERAWARVIGLNAVIMTVYLWHMTALLIGAFVLLPLGFPQAAPGGTTWWLLRPLWVAALAVILAAFVATVGRLEAGGLMRPRAADGATGARCALGATLAVAGTVGVAATGSVVGVQSLAIAAALMILRSPAGRRAPAPTS